MSVNCSRGEYNIFEYRIEGSRELPDLLRAAELLKGVDKISKTLCASKTATSSFSLKKTLFGALAKRKIVLVRNFLARDWLFCRSINIRAPSPKTSKPGPGTAWP
jgi:2-phospho-L-lactate transferase/gluconeogenesis factor (CofD/UPF0052 family)